MASSGLSITLEVSWLQQPALKSDHAFLVAELDSNFSLQSKHLQGTSRWGQGADWESSLSKASVAMLWIAGAAGLAALSPESRNWLRLGSKRKLRQSLLNKLIWFRSVVYTLCGHFGGAVYVTRSRQQSVSMQDELMQFWLAEQDPGRNGSIESELARKDLQTGLAADGQFKTITKFLDLSSRDKGLAQSCLTSILKPKLHIMTGLRDADSGALLTEQQTLELLSRNVVERGNQSFSGDPQFNQWVNRMVKQCRATCLQQVGAQSPSFMIPAAYLVDKLKLINTNKASSRLPRTATANLSLFSLAVTWAMINLIFSWAVLPPSWFRVVAPIRKRGPQIITDPSNLRPISYVDDLESTFDLVWLSLYQERLAKFAGACQAGGAYDPVLMTIGAVLAVQTRKFVGLPTFVLKADLLQGFDLAWRPAVLLNLFLSGVTGAGWLVLDAALTADAFKVRLGPLIGPLCELKEFGIGQGGRSAVHLFGILVQRLSSDILRATPMLGLGHTMTAARSVLQPNTRPRDETSPDLEAACDASLMFQENQAEADMLQLLHPSFGDTTALIMLDWAAKCRMSVIQFVDDIFVFQSTWWGINKACQEMHNFVLLWRHRFADGKKAPVFVPFGTSPGLTFSAIQMGTITVKQAAAFSILGVPVEDDLSFHMLLQSVTAKLKNAAAATFASMNNLGFGVPWQLDQIGQRIDPAALFGCELLASHFRGWPTVFKILNDAQYHMLKILLGVPTLSFGEGGQAKLFQSLLVPLRLGTRVAMRITMCLARLFLLPPCNPVGAAILAAQEATGSNWIRDARAVAASLGIYIFPSWEACTAEEKSNQAARKRCLNQWKLQVVLPQVRAFEQDWRDQQNLKLNSDLAVQRIHAVNKALTLVRSAAWGKTMWRFFRTWVVVAVTVTDHNLPEQISSSCLSIPTDLDDLHNKVRSCGLVFAAIISERTRVRS